MKLLIAGSRGFHWKEADRLVSLAMIRAINMVGTTLPPESIDEIVSGTAFGIDLAGERWARKHNIPVRQFPADWTEHGKAAGMIRNREMAVYSDGGLLLWDGISRGTQNMETELLRLKKPVILWNTKLDTWSINGGSRHA